jgi:hypothetical protein
LPETRGLEAAAISFRQWLRPGGDASLVKTHAYAGLPKNPEIWRQQAVGIEPPLCALELVPLVAVMALPVTSGEFQ